MKWNTYKYALLALLLPLQSVAEDIDLFLGVPPTTGGKPNVLVILDNTANWNTAFENERKALADTFRAMDPNDFNVGLMMFGESPDLGYVRAAIRPMSKRIEYDIDGDPNTDNTILYELNDSGAWEPALDDDDNEIPLTLNFLYAKMIEGFDVVGDRGNARTLARTFAEAHAYLTGRSTVQTSSNSGYGKNVKRDYHDNTGSGEEFTNLVHALDPNEANAFSNSSDFIYNSPPVIGICADTYIIYIGNTIPSGNVTTDNQARNNAAGADLAALGGDTTQITENFVFTSHQRNLADEWARYMHDELGIIFYAVDVDPTPYPDGQINGLGNSDLLRSLSKGVGGGDYFRVSSQSCADEDGPNDPNAVCGGEVADALNRIFSQILAKNSVFASVALPASTTGNSLFLNQVFIGLFRPDQYAYVRWPGNLKQYRLALDTQGDFASIKLFDAQVDDQGKPSFPAIDGNSGFIKECAQSYWTPAPSASDTYWSFNPQGTCPSPGPSKADSPDGPWVEKGAQSYVMRNTFADTPLSRKVYTCDYDIANCDDVINFDTTVITGASYEAWFDAADSDELDDLVNWAIGQDLENDDGDTNSTEIRPYIHSDVIHSRPIALNYGTDTNPSVGVFYGANDGMLRMINGNQTGNLAGVAPGAELWAFMPPEFFGEVKRIKANTDKVKVPASGPGSVGRTGTPKPYAVDGPITAYQGNIDDDNDNTTAELVDQRLIFAGMRRGGRSLYAFDVTDPNDPPDLLWKKGCFGSSCSDPNDPSDDPTWFDIGQTWSPASVAFIGGETNPILIMGGGYDTCEDTDNGTGGANHTCTPSDNGDHIYVIDAYTGELLREFDTLRAVPGAVTIVPTGDATIEVPNPPIQYVYAADTGGNVYRISAAGGAPLTTGTGTEVFADWEINRIASFGCGDEANSTCDPANQNRKFMFGPDVVRGAAGSTVFRILIGSGDREKPLESYSATTDVQNYFYSFVDDPANSDTWLEVSADCGLDMICMDILAPVTRSIDELTLEGLGEEELAAYPHGYAVALTENEQVVTSSLVVGDVANFSTHIPHDPNAPGEDVCENKLGTATTYNIGFEDAEGELIDIYTGGLVPSPVAGKVLICDGDNCTEVPFCIGCGGENSPIGGGTVDTGSDFDQAKGRVYWNIEQ